MFDTVTITPEQEAESERIWRDIDAEEALRLAWIATSTPVQHAPVVEARTRATRKGWGTLGPVVVWDGELRDPGINVPHGFRMCECLSRRLLRGCPCSCHGLGKV